MNPTVEFEGNNLIFKWDVDPNWDYELGRDQVMMLAYLPLNNTASFINSGARRDAGEDNVIETYISFISDDRQSISDSVYVGQIDIGNFKDIND